MEISRHLQATDRDDPRLGYAAAGALSFRIRQESAYQKSVRVDRIVEQLEQSELAVDDVLSFARTAARLLAASHAGGTPAGGAPALPAIAASLAGREDALGEELTAFLAPAAARLASDYALYLERLDRTGPYLRYRTR